LNIFHLKSKESRAGSNIIDHSPNPPSFNTWLPAAVLVLLCWYQCRHRGCHFRHRYVRAANRSQTWE